MKRTYEETHPWISFTLDLRPATHKLWMLLGEAQSKIEHISGVPLKPAVQQELLQVYLAKGAAATTAIEGNTLSEEEVRLLLNGDLELPPSKEYLRHEVDNVVAACNDIQARVFSGDSVKITAEELKRYNKFVLTDLELPPEVVPGEFRKHSVGVVRYLGAPHEDLEFLLAKFSEWMNTGFDAPEGQEMAFGIIKAVLAHLYIAWIHPFGDGNGRTARLIELEILLSVGVPVVAAHLLSNHYNLTRADYYRQLDAAHQNGGDPLPFVEYALRGFIDGLRDQITHVRDQQMAVHWIDFVHEVFRHKNESVANIRRRKLVIDLTSCEEPVPTPKIRQISPRMAEAYADKTDKTVKRDLNFLVNVGLVVKDENGYRAMTEQMAAFLPALRITEP